MNITHGNGSLTFVHGLQCIQPVSSRECGRGVQRLNLQASVKYSLLHYTASRSAFPGPPPVTGEMKLELLVCEGGWGNAGGLSAWSASVKTKEIEAVCDSGSAWGVVVMERVHETLSVSFVVLIYFSFPIFLSNFLPAFLKEPPSSCTLLERLYVKCSFLIWNKNPWEGIRLNLV